MLKLLFSMFDTIPVIMWASVEGKIRYVNKYCLNRLNNRMENIQSDGENFVIQSDQEKICIEQKDGINFCWEGKLYIHHMYEKEENGTRIKVSICNVNEVQKEKQACYYDALTGLNNRAYFDQIMEEILQKDNYPIGIIMGDINGLKSVNDTFGHFYGDKLVRKTADILLEATAENALVFRWGGAEFVIVCLSCSENDCEKRIDRINERLMKSNVDKLELSVSMAYAVMKKDDYIDHILKLAENRLYNHKLFVQKSKRSSILATLKASLQAKNVETEEHTQRVFNDALEIGMCLALTKEILDELALVATLHDIGKIAIPEQILLKSVDLTEEEYEIMKTHSEWGYRLAYTIPEITHVAKGILTHHEYWNGKGYPLGLSGTKIPLVSRIVAVVDAYDAMTSNRGYNIAKTELEARNELIRCSGSQFDPEIVQIFCKILGERKNKR